MTRAIRFSLLAAASLGAVALSLAIGRDGKRDARASDPVAAPAPTGAQLVFAHGEVDGMSTEIAIASVDAAVNVAPVKPLGTVTHTPGSAIRGANLGDVAFVVAQTEGPRGTSYDGVLYRVEGGTATKLCDQVMRAATPIVTSTGRVIVARGGDGQDPPESEAQKLVLRTDDLTIDDVDPITGVTRPLWRGQGYQAFLGTVTRGAREELVVYHSTATGSSLFALDPATTTTRTLWANAVPFARDFSFDRVHGAVVFADLSPDGRNYQVLSLDLASLALRALHTSPNEHLMPFALPSGDVAISSDGDKGLAVLKLSSSGAQHRLVSPLGDGTDEAMRATADGRWVAVRHTPNGQVDDDPPLVVAWDPSGNRVVRLNVPTSHFVEPFGFVGGGAL